MCRDAGHDDGSATTLVTSIRLRLLLVCRDSNPLSQCHWVQGGPSWREKIKVGMQACVHAGTCVWVGGVWVCSFACARVYRHADVHTRVRSYSIHIYSCIHIYTPC